MNKYLKKLITALLKDNSLTIQFAHLKGTFSDFWHVHSYVQLLTTVKFRTFLSI